MRKPRKPVPQYATCIRSEILDNDRGRSLRLTITAEGADRDAYIYASLADTADARYKLRQLTESFGFPTRGKLDVATFVNKTIPLTNDFDKSFKYYSVPHTAPVQEPVTQSTDVNTRIDEAIELLRSAARILKELKRNAAS